MRHANEPKFEQHVLHSRCRRYRGSIFRYWQSRGCRQSPPHARELDLNFIAVYGIRAVGRTPDTVKKCVRAPSIRDAQVRVLPPGLRVLANSYSYMRRFESCRPSQPVRSLWAASLALSDSDQQPRQIGGMSVGGASYSSGVVRLSRPLPYVRAARRAPGSSPPPCW